VKVLIAGGGTGGHLIPALTLGDELASRRRDIELVYVGATRGIEATLLPARGVKHYLLPAEPIYRRTWWKNARWPLIAWRVLQQSGAIVRDERPVLAIGTGGYASGPVLWVAARHGVPLVIQEQNAYPGIVTRWLAGRARQVHLGFPEAARFITPGVRTEVFTLGNPIAPPAQVTDVAAARARLGVPAGAPVVLVMGGSQGARGINRALAAALDANLLPGITVLWSTGQAHWEAYRRYHALPARQVRGFWDPIADAYAAADLVVARSGAMTIAEVCAYGLASVLIPLPTAAADHQSANATALAAAGAARVLPESALTAGSLAATIRDTLADAAGLAATRAMARNRGKPEATRDIVTRILSLLPSA
jgi:UDP-N-acetylglucosamine--N-acetylmuramyl-(pentapeptide) pyrophosphoryl-undecaprenol N-acetylglucosamine transferase